MVVARFGTPNSLSVGGVFSETTGSEAKNGGKPHLLTKATNNKESNHTKQGVQEAMTEPPPNPGRAKV